MLEDAGRLAGKTGQKADDQRAEQAEQRGGEARGHALERLLQRAEQLLERIGGSGAARRTRQRADDAAHRAHHVQQADERSDQAHEDQKPGHVAEQRLLVVDGAADLVDQRVHGLDRNPDLLGARQLVGHEVIGVPEQPRPLEYPPRTGATVMTPERIGLLLDLPHADVVPHLLQRVEGDDFVLELVDEDEGHDDRERKGTQDRTRGPDVRHHAFLDEVPLPGADDRDNCDQSDHLVPDIRNLLFHNPIPRAKARSGSCLQD